VKTLTRALMWSAWATAIGAFTMTPLMGFVVGDKKPSLAATALQMVIAVLLMLCALGTSVADRQVRRVRRAAEIRRRAFAHGAALNPVDRFAPARKQALEAGLPWIESDGSVTWPAP
jgi:uncharacterized membrane protein